MSIIKEIYDVAKDVTNQLAKKGAIKRAIKTDLKLNRKFLADIENGIKIYDYRRIGIIQMLELIELAPSIKNEIPYLAISNKKVTDEIARKYKISKLYGEGIEEVI